jgi:hypothetical protein
VRRPWETAFGLVLLTAGLPFYFYWRRANRKAARVQR